MKVMEVMKVMWVTIGLSLLTFTTSITLVAIITARAKARIAARAIRDGSLSVGFRFDWAGRTQRDNEPDRTPIATWDLDVHLRRIDPSNCERSHT